MRSSALALLAWGWLTPAVVDAAALEPVEDSDLDLGPPAVPADDGEPRESADVAETDSEAAPESSAAPPENAASQPAAASEASEPTVDASAAEATATCLEDVSPLVPKSEHVHACPAAADETKMTFKPGNGLSVKSKDGRFKLETRLRAQFLYSIENDHEAQSTTQGLEIRRARLQFTGNVFNEHNKFKVEFALSPRDMAMAEGTPRRTPILDWYFDFDYFKSATLRVGQYKIPYSRQRVISSGNLQLVDRALAQGEFNLDRDIGVDLRSKDFLGLGKLRYYAFVGMGEGRDAFELDTFELLYIGRVEVLPLGLFEDYDEGDFERSKKPRLSLGAAYAFLDAGKRNRGILGNTPTDGGTTDTHNFTADFVFKVAGFSATGEFFWRDGRRNFGEATIVDDMGMEVPAERERARDGLGWFLQAGYMIPRVPVEIAARYSEIRPLHRDSSALPFREEVGGGLSWYIARHNLKLQADYFRGWEDDRIVQGTDLFRLQLQGAF